MHPYHHRVHHDVHPLHPLIMITVLKLTTGMVGGIPLAAASSHQAATRTVTPNIRTWGERPLRAKWHLIIRSGSLKIDQYTRSVDFFAVCRDHQDFLNGLTTTVREGFMEWPQKRSFQPRCGQQCQTWGQAVEDVLSPWQRWWWDNGQEMFIFWSWLSIQLEATTTTKKQTYK